MLLALVAIAVLTVQGFVPAAVRAGRSSVAPFVVVAGRAVPYDGPQAWTTASILSRTSRRLEVFATGSTDGGGSPCGPPVLQFRLRETASAVRVLVAGYQAPSALATACAAIGYLPGPHPVRLERPLGSRAVIDESTGHAVTVVDGDDRPTLPHPPIGLHAQPLLRQGPHDPVFRGWTAPGVAGPFAVAVITRSPASTRVDGPYGRTVQQALVGSTPATLYRGVGTDPGTWFVQWTPNRRPTITLRVATAGRFRWTAASALQLARQVSGYRSEPTGRLGEPVVRRTVAATYSSADGPVQGATNLLKSSGVFVGVDCIGPGRLTVMMRGRSYRLACASSLRHHEFESVGAADQSFDLSVHAPPDLRWSLSLARATLDGT